MSIFLQYYGESPQRNMMEYILQRVIPDFNTSYDNSLAFFDEEGNLRKSYQAYNLLSSNRRIIQGHLQVMDKLSSEVVEALNREQPDMMNDFATKRANYEHNLEPQIIDLETYYSSERL